MPDATNTDLLIILTRVETKLDLNVKQGDDQEQRLRKAEKRLWQIPSVAVVISMIGVGVDTLSRIR